MSFEVVLRKRRQVAIPSMCPGCGGDVETVRPLGHSSFLQRLRSGGLILNVGLCRPCSDAYTQRETPAQRQALIGAVAAVIATGAMLALPVLPEALTLLIPCAAAAAVLATAWRRARESTTAVRHDGPYRSVRPTGKPKVPIQLVRADGFQATIYCASEAWATSVAALNHAEIRRAPALPRPPYLDLGATVAMLAAAACGWGAHNYQWPALVIDNPTNETMTVFVDGEARWKVDPRAPEQRAREVRLPRGVHRITHQVGSASRAEEMEITLGGMRKEERKLYDPLASGCYRRAPVVYGEAEIPEASYLPSARVLEAKAAYILEAPPASKSIKSGRAEIAWVIQRDDLCLRTSARPMSTIPEGD